MIVLCSGCGETHHWTARCQNGCGNFWNVDRSVALGPINADAARVSLAFESIVEALREALSLATALHARDHRADIAECAQDRRQAETLSQAERRVHAVMWERESPAVRERYAAEAVGLLAWMKGAK